MDVSLIQNGVVVQIVSADSVEQAVPFYPAFTCMFNPGDVEVGATYANGVFTNPPPPAPTTISKVDWLGRFTPAELAGIYAAVYDPSTNIAVRGPAAAIMALFDAAPDPMNKADPRTVQALGGLVALGLIASNRPAEILA